MSSRRDILDEYRRLVEQERRHEAIKLLSQVIATAPSHELYSLLGEEYEHLGEYEKAVDSYSSAIELEPNQTKYLESRGVLLSTRLSRVEESLDDFHRAAEIDPTRPGLQQQLSLSYLQLGNLDAACDHAERAIALGDSNGYSHYCLGQCRLAAERYRSAVKQFQIALKLNPENPRFWKGLCTTHEKMGELDRAESCCENAIKFEPLARSYIKLAKIQLGRANPQGAITSLETAKTLELQEDEQFLVDGYLAIARQRV